MSLDNYKITQGDIETKGVVAAPDVMSGEPQANKRIFDRLIREAVAVQFNAMVDALTASSGAGEIGAAVDGIAAGTVLGVMSALKVLHDTTEQTQGATNESVQAALGNRYTKDQTDTLLQGKLDTVTANQLVRSIEFNAETGVFTITTQGGAVSTIDTMLERVPASFTLENNQLVLTLEDGTRQTADLSVFIDTYTFTSGGTVAFSQNGKTVTAEVRDGSLALSKLTPEAQATLASYASRAEAAKESAEAARAGAEAARDAAQGAAATAEEKAAAAAGSAGAAKQSETNAKGSETAAKTAKDAAEGAAQTLNSAQINAEGHLILTAPDGAIRDLGNVTGETGASGVYIGSDTPPEHANVWVNPAGDPTGTEDWEFDMLDGTTDEKTVVVIGAEDGSGRLGILRVRNADGTWTDIPAIVGKQGPKGDTGEVDYSRLEDYAQKTEVTAAVSEHNTSQTSHNDIRRLIEGLTSRLNALANSDDITLDQMAEVVTYIKDNRSLIEQITTGKVSVSDIVDNLTTNVGNKPLSAAQGVALKALIDGITVPTKTSQLENDSGFLKNYTETDPTVPAWAKAASKPTYTASEVGARPNTWTPSASDIGLNTESWTFTLEDGSTVTKAVYVG